MSLTRFAVKHPLAMLMIVAALCLLGATAYTQLAVKRLPDVSYPHISVAVSYPGVLAENVRTEALDPLENALATLGGIDNMTSTASNGRGRINIRFDAGLDIDQKAAEVAHAIDAVSGSLPVEVPTPTVVKADPDAAPILSVAIAGAGNRADLYNLVVQTIEPAIAHVPGVADVTLTGGKQPQINIAADPTKLLLYGVSLDDIVQALNAAAKSVPGGTTQQAGRELPVETMSAIGSVDDFRRVPIAVQGKSIALGQVADVSVGSAPIETESVWNGRTAMSLYVTAQSSANPLDVSDAVRAAVAALQSKLPQDVQLKVIGDLTVYTRHALTAVQTDLFIAILAAGIVLALFLRRLRPTLIVLLAIPTSLLLAGLIMYALRFSLDLISLLAMSLLIGILIDDAIVVLENIDRHRRMGKDAVAAAIDGRTEIGWAAVAITLTDVVVYVPVAFMSGNVGQLFREFGLTIASASLFSLLVSFTLTPLCAAHWLRGGASSEREWRFGGRGPHPGASRLRSKLQDGYTKLQTTFVQRPYVPLAILLACGVFTWGGLTQGWVSSTFTPDENAGVLSVQVTMPVGTAETVTKRAVDRLSQSIGGLPAVAGVLATTGFGGGAVTGSNIGRLTVELKSDAGLHGSAQTTADINRLAQAVPGAKIKVSTDNPLLTESGGTLHLVLRGLDLDTLGKLSQQFIAEMKGIPGISNIDSSLEANTPQWSIEQNQQAAALYGVTTRQLGQAVRVAVQGDTVSQYVPPDSLQGEPVVLQLKDGGTLSLEQMLQLPVGRAGGNLIRLGQVAHLDKTAAPNKIEEYDRELQASITANVNDSELGKVVQELQPKLRKIGMPAGSSYKLAGAAEQQDKAFGPLLKALGLSVLLIYMLLAALYESFLDPLVVILTLPFAASGGLLALWATGTPFSLYAFIAMIMLMGLVAKNAILLIDNAKQGMKRGMEPEQALLAAGQVRLRPIAMTTMTMVLAMLPLALPFGTGSADRMPLALVLIGGMLLSTVLTLLVLPSCYFLLLRVIRVGKERIMKRKRGIPNGD